MDLATISLIVLAPILLLSKKSSGFSKHVEYDPTPKEKQGSVKIDLDNYLRAIEKDFDLDGIRDSFMAFAYVESRYIPNATRPESTGYKLVYKPKAYTEPLEQFKNNPWVKDKVFWNFTGGILQIFPGNALNTLDGTANNLDPRLIFNWKYSLAFAIDFAYRLNKKYNAFDWLRIRYAWSSLSLLANYNTTMITKANQVKGRVIEGIQKSNGNMSSLYKKPNFSKYAEFQFEGMLEYILHF